MRKNALHPFETAGLGEAPFKYLRMTYNVGPIRLDNGITVGAPGQPMGTCDYCGQGIAHECRIASADGKEFVVGIDCVNKLFLDSNATPAELARDPVYREYKRDKARLEAAKRHARQDAKIADGKLWAVEHRAELESLPDRERAKYGTEETLWDKYEWYMKNAGRAGKLRIFKILKYELEMAAKLKGENS